MLTKICFWNRISCTSCFIPKKAPLKKKVIKEKKKENVEKDKVNEQKYLPYIPSAYVTDTVLFFKDKNKLNNLLSLIFSPKNSCDTYEDRLEYQKKYELYEILKNKKEKIYTKHIEKMKQKTFKAIKNLPKELFHESIKEGEFINKKEIKFGLMYENLLLNNLNTYKKKLLHVYKILLYLRYPFYLIKKKNPLLFYITEGKAISRQKQINAQKKKIKKNITK